MLINDHSGDLIETLPSLRRYAFCLVGRKDEGDALVARFLYDLPTDNNQLSSRSCSVALFKAFNADRSLTAACRDAADRNSWAVDDALHAEILALPVKPRQALILVRAIGFCHDDAGEIMRRPVEDVARSVAAAVDRIFWGSRLHPIETTPGPEANLRVPAQH